MTALSKKVIFHLHRFNADHGWPYNGTGNDKLLAEAHAKLDQVYGILRECGANEELQSVQGSDDASPEMQRYEPFIGPSLEELIEAASFLYFLEHASLMPNSVVQDRLRSNTGSPLVHVSPRRYVLGVSDLTGELMRLAINSVATRQCTAVIRDVIALQKDIYAGVYILTALEPLAVTQGEIRKKQSVTLSSLRKVEDAAYSIHIRSAGSGVLPEHMHEIVQQALS